MDLVIGFFVLMALGVVAALCLAVHAVIRIGHGNKTMIEHGKMIAESNARLAIVERQHKFFIGEVREEIRKGLLPVAKQQRQLDAMHQLLEDISRRTKS